jgi:4-amino-4-deoxy-L-arabinose transferase-like glycosyltransferase
MRADAHRLPAARTPLLARLAGIRWELALIGAASIILLGHGISEPPLLDWDEATYAQVARESLARGSFLDLTWNGEPYLKKPPLLFWLIAGSFSLFGESEFAARLPSVIFGTGTVLLLYAFARPVAGRAGATLAALFPFTFYFFVARGGRECATDAPLLFFITLALFAFDRARTRRSWLAIAGAACGLALLSKGLAGAIPSIAAALAVAVVPAFRVVGLSGLAAIGATAGAVVAPWLAYQLASQRDLFWTVYVEHETFARVTRHVGDTPRAPAATIRTYLSEAGALWPALLPLAALASRSLRSGAGGALGGVNPTIALWMLWLAVALGAAFAVQTKLPWYVLPALIPTALLAASAVGYALKTEPPAPRYVAVAALLAIVLIAIQMPRRWNDIELTVRHQRELSTPSMMIGLRARDTARERGGGELVFAGVPLPTLVYYSGLRTRWMPASRDRLSPAAPSDAVPVAMSSGDLVLVDPRGEPVTVANLGAEWRISGPGGSARIRPPRSAPD